MVKIIVWQKQGPIEISGEYNETIAYALEKEEEDQMVIKAISTLR